MSYLIERFKEPSSWAGISAVALAFGVSAGEVNVIVQAGAALAGLASFFLKG